jgi:hypothetical protein
MSQKRLRVSIIGGVCGLCLLLPFVFTLCRTSGLNVYYEDERRCVCGHITLYRLTKDGIYSYSPGHGVPESLRFKIRAHDAQWDIMGLPHSDVYASPLDGENRVIGHLKVSNGSLYQSWGSSTNWARYPRVLNPYRVWYCKLVDQISHMDEHSHQR